MTSRGTFFSLVMAVILYAITLVGCTSDQKSVVAPEQSERLVDGQTVQPEGYPLYSFQLNAPWLSQLPPKNPDDSDLIAWSKTKNCGQTCAVMVRGYLSGTAVNSAAIESADRLLAKNYGAIFNPPYSAITNTGKIQWLCQQYGLQATTGNGETPADVVNIAASGRPVIVAVRLRMSNSANVLGHFMVLVGYNGAYLYFHDPGRSSASDGRYVRYTVAQFDASWATQGRAYIKVWK